MTYVVTQPCFGCTYMDCAEICPVNAFHVNEEMLYINPETCIDCDICVPECPVEAIFPDDLVPEMWKDFIALNAEMAPQLPSWDNSPLKKIVKR
jgi:ferredoxin